MILTEISSLFSFGTTYFLAQKRLKIPGGGPRCLFFFGHNNGTYTLARMHTHTHTQQSWMWFIPLLPKHGLCAAAADSRSTALCLSRGAAVSAKLNWTSSLRTLFLCCPTRFSPFTTSVHKCAYYSPVCLPPLCHLSLECETSLTWIIMKLLSGDV